MCHRENGQDDYYRVKAADLARQGEKGFRILLGKRYQTHLKRKVPTFKVLKFYPILPPSKF